MELSNSNIKNLLIFQETESPQNFLIFSQKKAFLVFWETETPKKLFIFQETQLSYISGGTSKPPKTKVSYISPKKVMNKCF